MVSCAQSRQILGYAPLRSSMPLNVWGNDALSHLDQRITDGEDRVCAIGIHNVLFTLNKVSAWLETMWKSLVSTSDQNEGLN